jgi:phthiocerol/phenolphthiocerol synthesis type-I polyketide synthase E
VQDSMNGTEIAVVGMAGRFPGARDLDEFWQNLCDGVESIRFPSDEELRARGVSEALLRDPNYVKASAALDGMELFDAGFFGYTPREAELMDPQHRVFLECSWEALERAGYDPDKYSGAIGVFAGGTTNTYLLYNLVSNPNLLNSLDPVQIDVGNGADFLATRASYKFNLKGPSCTIQTACSTSLVAVHTACQSLLNQECDMALAGGVSINVKHPEGYRYLQGSIVSPDGRCRAFDAQASGTIFGSGVGVVVLKRLQDALACDDYVYAVIKGSAINNDGAVKVGYTAPSVEGQAAVITEALSVAGVQPETISYIEAHGTATQMGDPIEIRALTRAFRTVARPNSCAIGSVKSNIGHLAGAAGVAGLIKTVLMLEHRMIPPSLHFEKPTPEIEWDQTPFYVNTRLTEWKTDGKPRRAGQSAFGVGGTNAHVVLEEAPLRQPSGPARPAQLLLLAAKTNTALEAATANLAAFLRACPNLNLADVAYTLAVGRQGFNRRRAVVCRTLEEAASALEVCDPQRMLAGVPDIDDRPVVFMFPGQGAQYVNMARELLAEPVFREHLDRCVELLEPHLGLDLRELIYPAADRAEYAAQQLEQTGITQPALFVIEYALAQLWMSWGIRPQAMIGHSIGEYVAACLAGVMALPDALALVAARGKLMQGQPVGAMLAVSLPEAQVQALLTPELSLASVNSPSLCVVSGPQESNQTLEDRMAEKGVTFQRLHTSHAFHSSMMDSILAPFARRVRQVKLNPPQIPYLSNVTGEWIKAEQATDPDYWAQHLRQTVRFSDGIRELVRDPARVLLEVGPGTTCTRLARQHGDPGRPPVVLATTRHPKDSQSDEDCLLTTLGKLWLAGVKVNWAGFYAKEHRHRLPLPTYPFDRQKYWIEPGAQIGTFASPASLSKRADVSSWFYAPAWKSAPPRRFTALDLADYKGGWLLFVDELGLGAEMAQRLRESEQSVITVRVGENWGRVEQDGFMLNPGRPQDYVALLQEIGKLPERIIHLWSLTPNADALSSAASFDESQERGFYSLLFLTQALVSQRAGPTRLQVISNHTQHVVESETVMPEKATLPSLCNVIPYEHPEIACQHIDVSLASSGTPESAQLIGQLLAEFKTFSETMLAYRGRQRWTQTFEPMSLEPAAEPIRPLRPGGVYLITNGLAGIGLSLARYLARSVQARLVLIGDSAAPQDVPRDLEALGAEVLVVQADLADEAQMRAAVAQAMAHFGRIHGVIHAAGVTDERALSTIRDTDEAACQRHFEPKVYGLFALEKALSGVELDFCLLNSSLSTVLGGLGYVAYAAADLFMDVFAQRQNTAGRQTWISVNWDAWQSEGEAQTMIAARAEWMQLALTPEEGGQALERILASSTVDRVLVSTSDLAARMEQERQKIQSLRGQGQVEQLALHERPELRSAYVAPRDDLERRIAEIWQQVLGIQQVGIHDDFFDLGGHSLLATQLRNQLYEAFKVDLALQSLFENATVAGVAQLIARHSQSAPQDEKPIAERLRTAFPTERQSILEGYLRPKIAQALNIAVEKLPADGNLASFNMELIAVDLMWRLKQDFKLQFYPHEFALNPSIPQLARYLMAEIDRASDLTRLATVRPLSSFRMHPYQNRASRHYSIPAQKNNSMVFMHSSPRAGSTLLRIMLAGHPSLFCPPELNMLFFEDMQEWHQNIGFGHELEWTAAGVQWAFMELMGLDSERGQAFVDDLVARNESVQHIYARLQELAGSRLLLDKTPTYSMDLDTLKRAEELFDKPKYIYLFRHPYPVMESLLRIRLDKLFGPSLFDEPDVDPYAVAETVWAISNRNLLTFLDQIEPERCCWVRYEDLVSQTPQVMEGVCRFLGIPFHESVLNPYDGRRERMMGGLGDPNILQHSGIEAELGKAWKNIHWPRRLDASTQQLAARLGYDLPEIETAQIGPGAFHAGDEERLLANLDQLSDEQVSAMLQNLWAQEEGNTSP